MANRSRRPRQKRRQLPALAAQRDTHIGAITGKDCDHSQCGRARQLMMQIVFANKQELGLSSAGVRRVTARIPEMLCTPGAINLVRKEHVALLAAFILACNELGVESGWLGHVIPGIDELRAQILAAQAEGQQPDPEA